MYLLKSTVLVRIVFKISGERCSSVVERPLLMRWVVGSIRHGDPLSYISFKPMFSDWCIKGMCYPVFGIVHVKESSLLIGKSTPYSGGSEFPLSRSGPLPHTDRQTDTHTHR